VIYGEKAVILHRILKLRKNEKDYFIFSSYAAGRLFGEQ